MLDISKDESIEFSDKLPRIKDESSKKIILLSELGREIN